MNKISTKRIIAATLLFSIAGPLFGCKWSPSKRPQKPLMLPRDLVYKKQQNRVKAKKTTPKTRFRSAKNMSRSERTPKSLTIPRALVYKKQQNRIKAKKTTPKTRFRSAKNMSLAKQLRTKKRRLQHVSDSEKNVYAKILLSQRAPYFAENDINPFIKKLHIENGLTLHNSMDHSIHLAVDYQRKNGQIWTEQLTAQPGRSIYIDKPTDGYLHALRLLSNNKTAFLNPKFENGVLHVLIEDIQDRYFLHQFHDFNFLKPPFTQNQLTDPSLSSEERSFRHDFNNACIYLNAAGQEEGTSLSSIKKQRQDLYTKNNFGRLCAYEPNLIDSTTYRIPLITHKIWVTADNNPCDPSIQYIKWFEQSIKNNNLPKDGWAHYFWIESKEKLPKLTALLEDHPYIILRELSEIEFTTGDLYKDAIAQKKFGKASDIIRLELLRHFGGFYLDTDYEVYQSLAPYAKAYDMIVGLEPMSPYLCNAFIGSCPQHPVLIKSLEMIMRNLGPDAPQYIKNAPNNGFRTIIETGPVLFSFAFALAGGSSGYRDIVLPPQLIYPAQSNKYPSKMVVTPDGKIPAEALGGHYWNTAWMDPQFGGNG